MITIPSQGPIEGIPVPLGAFADLPSCTVTAYLGIPFAQPPTGERRWKRPQTPPPSWSHGQPRRSRWAKEPIQNYDLVRMFGMHMRGDDALDDDPGGRDETLADEDCLYLNIWVPQGVEAGANVPVLVWVYGGGFVVGAASQPQYDGARLASVTGSIVVSLTYRTGVLGFLGSRELTRDEDASGAAGTGNYGLWDLVAGLQWVQDRIAVFGGDASRVTAFGESAGAINLHYLMLSPTVPAGLFARVALFSGAASSVLPRTIPSSQVTFDALAARLGADQGMDGEQKTAILRDASPQRLLDAFHMLPAVRPRSEYLPDAVKGRPSRRMDHVQDTLKLEASSLCGPVWDGVMIANDFAQLVARGVPLELKNGRKGVFLGNTGDEGSIFTLGMSSTASLARSLNVFDAEMRAKVEMLYGAKSVRTDLAAKAIGSGLLGDLMFTVPVNALTDTLARQTSVPTFRYVWSHRPSDQLKRSLAPNRAYYDFLASCGAYHACEVPFLFGWQGFERHTFARDDYPGPTVAPNPSGVGTVGFTDEERRLSVQLMGHLAIFAQGGAPWTSCSGKAPAEAGPGMPDIPIMAYDDLPCLGATSPHAMRTLSRHADGQHAIEVGERSLHSMLTWTKPVDADAQGGGGVGSAADKHVFWTEDNFRRPLLYYYGDERIRFIP